MEIHIIELPKIICAIKEDMNEYEKNLLIWLKFMKNPNIIEGEKVEKIENINAIRLRKEYEEIVWGDYEQYKAEIRELRKETIKRARRSGYEEGIEDGREESKKQMKEIAKALIKENMAIYKIAKITGLTEDEIKKLK